MPFRRLPHSIFFELLIQLQFLTDYFGLHNFKGKLHALNNVQIWFPQFEAWEVIKIMQRK